MKRSDNDIEASITTKEPRLEVEDSATCSSSSSAAQETFVCQAVNALICTLTTVLVQC